MKLIAVALAERMRVKPTARLLSHHVSTLAKRVFEKEPEISEFIETINNGFDVLNSRIPVDTSNPIKSGLGMQ